MRGGSIGANQICESGGRDNPLIKTPPTGAPLPLLEARRTVTLGPSSSTGPRAWIHTPRLDSNNLTRVIAASNTEEA